ncbi:hypothetical protein H5410_034293 [Solanum commersonii]|uniref:Uncharacterized protein n=1 Tax=Solanum commersonii TaxID=4109 RepID=A0A9J5YQ92_SOLCO|nr:hypothetical protein H5410_034293 [Solanum commersonii]
MPKTEIRRIKKMETVCLFGECGRVTLGVKFGGDGSNSGSRHLRGQVLKHRSGQTIERYTSGLQ